MSARVSDSELMGRNAYARHRGCAPNAVTRAVRDGRIARAVLYGKGGKIRAIRWRLADELWTANTDQEMALRTRFPLQRSPPAPRVQPVVHASVHGAEPARDPDDAEALRFAAALEAAIVALPAELVKAGLAGTAIDELLEQLYGVMLGELRARGENEAYIAAELRLLRERVAEERAQPGKWTT